jgi:hypothetical protein
MSLNGYDLIHAKPTTELAWWVYGSSAPILRQKWIGTTRDGRSGYEWRDLEVIRRDEDDPFNPHV